MTAQYYTVLLSLTPQYYIVTTDQYYIVTTAQYYILCRWLLSIIHLFTCCSVFLLLLIAESYIPCYRLLSIKFFVTHWWVLYSLSLTTQYNITTDCSVLYTLQVANDYWVLYSLSLTFLLYSPRHWLLSIMYIHCHWLISIIILVTYLSVLYSFSLTNRSICRASVWFKKHLLGVKT